MARLKSYTKIIDELLTTDPVLINANDEVFLQAFREAATLEGHTAFPEYWNTLREYRRAKAKLAGKSRKRIAPKVLNFLTKARQSALEAVANYNNPLSPFRSGTYIVLMNIAWTSLALAVISKRGTKPYRIDSTTGKYKKRADGEYEYLFLHECIEILKTEIPAPIIMNLQFMSGLRNKIEHALMPELDLIIFGECQAMLVNFEDLLVREFGDEYALNESLAFSLQFSRLRMQDQDNATRHLHAEIKPSIREYVDNFRSSLSDDILSDMAYSFKVFLLPNIGNYRSSDALAIEWVNFDANDPKEMESYTKSVALIKERHIPVANLNNRKASEVAELVKAATGKAFNASTHHAKCWKHYGIRPLNGDPCPERCKQKYCIYDRPHSDYVYTDKWIEFLIQELSDPVKYEMIFPSKKLA